MFVQPIDIQRARALYEASRHLLLADIIPIDLKDRVALITVAAGLRSVGVLECGDFQLELVRDALINHGLFTLRASTVWSYSQRVQDHKHLKYLEMLDEMRNRKESIRRVLWFCASSSERNRIKSSELTKEQAGLLLGYPECCVRQDVRASAEVDVAFIEALIDKVGEDKQDILGALQDDVPVEVSCPHLESDAVPRTDARFPFVLHIACPACLENETSPSAEINGLYGELIQAVDPQLYAAIIKVRGLLGELRSETDARKRDGVLADVDAIHRSVFPNVHT